MATLPDALIGLAQPLLFKRSGHYHLREVETLTRVPRKLLRALETQGRLRIRSLRPGSDDAPCWEVHLIDEEPRG